MPQAEEKRNPAQAAASWPGLWRDATPPPVPPAWYYPPPGWCPPPPVEEPTAPDGAVSKLTYTVTEAAEAIGVSRATMYELIHREGFPTLKVGNRRLISRELLAEWVRKQASTGRGW